MFLGIFMGTDQEMQLFQYYDTEVYALYSSVSKDHS